MISKTIEASLNEQIKNEFDSAYLYLSMSTYCESVHLTGCSHWLRMQWEEEIGHALKLVDFLHDRGGRVLLGPLEQPDHNWDSVLALFRDAYEHEKGVTKLIHQLYVQATAENDYATQVALQWFVTEQVEEEKTAGDLVAELERVGDDTMGLLFIDRNLSERAAASVG